MDITTFWNLMEQTKRVDVNNRDKQTNLLVEELVQLSEEEIIG